MPLPHDWYNDYRGADDARVAEARYWTRKMKRERDAWKLSALYSDKEWNKVTRERDELQKEVGRLAIYEPLSETWMERTFYQQKKVSILTEALADIAEFNTAVPLDVLQIIDRALAKVG